MADTTPLKLENLSLYDQEAVIPEVKAAEQLIKDTVGWTGKNEWSIGTTKTISGMTFNVNSDGSVTLNGTATNTPTSLDIDFLPEADTEYIISGCPSGGSDNSYRIDWGGVSNTISYGDPVKFSLTQHVIDTAEQKSLRIRVVSGFTASNLTFYPMLRKADILDDTYEPYHKTVEDIVGDLDVFTGATESAAGKKGLVPAPAIITGGDKFLCHDGSWKSVGGNIPSFGQATDAQVTQLLEYHRLGLIDLTNIWAVGEERPVHLSAMAATGVEETHVEQDQTLVILHGPDMFDLVDGGKNTFVIGLKNMLANNGTREGGKINATNTNVGGWQNSVRRPWCDDVFMKALPEEVQKWFKKFKYKASDGNKLTTLTEMENYFTLPAEIEVFGSTTYSVAGEGTQFDYYKTTANRKKYPGDSSTSAAYWWERSPRASGSSSFCVVASGGSAFFDTAAAAFGLSPFGCV